MTDRSRSGAGSTLAKQPHAATVARGTVVQARTKKAAPGPHPATVARGSVAQARTSERAVKPHPATVPRGSAGSAAQAKTTATRVGSGTAKTGKGSVVMMSKGNALAKLSASLPDIDTERLTANWDAARAAPPHVSLTLKALQDGRASAFWDFECRGQDGHVSYNTGTYNVAHVTIRAGNSAPLINYWFMIDGRGSVVDAETRAFVQKATAQVFSRLPSDYQAPIRLLLEAMYAGATY